MNRRVIVAVNRIRPVINLIRVPGHGDESFYLPNLFLAKSAFSGYIIADSGERIGDSRFFTALRITRRAQNDKKAKES